MDTSLFQCLFFSSLNLSSKEVRKAEKIRNRYDQVSHMTQDTNRKVTKTQLNITNKSQEGSPFLAAYHKAAINRRESMINTRHK